MDTTNLALLCLGALFVLLLAADLVLSIVVIMRMRGRGEHATVRSGTDRAFIRGWKHPDLRPYMIAWTAVGVLTVVVFCVLLVVLLAM